MELKQKIIENLSKSNVLSQKGMVEMFDSTIGRSTVLMPFGGITQRTETQVSVQKLPVGNHFTNTASIMAYGYNPDISSWSPYHGAQYAVIEAITKIVAAGGRYNNIRFSFQEYFEKMTDNPFSWGKPTAALLGALQMQHDFHLPAIGGKDSMSGSFLDINVPPMLMAFGITTVDARVVISTEFKQSGNYIYLIKHHHNGDYTPNTGELKQNYDFISSNIENKYIVSAFALVFGGLAEAVCKMAFGNNIGVEMIFDESENNSFEQFEKDLFALSYGSVLVESNKKLDCANAIYIGKTIEDKEVRILAKSSNNTAINVKTICSLQELYRANTEKFASIYPITSDYHNEKTHK